MESVVVVGLVAAIFGGSYVIDAVRPSSVAQEVVVGDKKIRVTQVGKGGVQPGVLVPRTVSQTPVSTVVTPAPTVTKPPKVRPTPTPTPTAVTDPGGPPPIIGGGGGGNGSGGGQNCRLLVICSSSPSADPGATETVDPGTDPGTAAGDPTPAATSTPKPKKKQPATPN